MCTVTYIPRGNNEFLLASNRDENNQRSTNRFQTKALGPEKVLFPVDPVSGGSWIVASNAAKVACVLNGAFDKHRHNPPYAKSRGLVILDYFRLNSMAQFTDQYDFKGIEPFTMVACEQSNLYDFRWDGSRAHVITCDPNQPHMWSSSTLYDQSAKDRRRKWFKNWLTNCPEPNILDLIHFHLFGGEQDLNNGFVMNRQGMVQTLSVAAIDKRNTHADIHHHDLIQDRTSRHRIDFSENEVVETV